MKIFALQFCNQIRLNKNFVLFINLSNFCQVPSEFLAPAHASRIEIEASRYGI